MMTEKGYDDETSKALMIELGGQTQRRGAGMTETGDDDRARVR